MHIYSRRKVSLNGTWGIQVDPYRRGVASRIWECRKERAGSGPENFDVEAFRRIKVPGDWNTSFKDLYHYEGLAWYHREVKKPSAARRRRTFLYFEAVNYKASIYWNGELLGTHEGGFTPFWFEVTGKLKATNNLVLAVDGTRTRDAIPAPIFDWFRYLGIFRPAWFVFTPRTYVADFALRTEARRKGHQALVDVWVKGAKAGVTVSVRIPELHLHAQAKLNPNGRGRTRIKLDGAQLWSPGNPKLYRIEIECAKDRISDEVGFRTVAREGEDILLNGKPVFLRGVCVHEEAPHRRPRTTTGKDVARLFDAARDLGLNFLRLAHYPHSELVAREADRRGVLLWEEIPLWQKIHFESKYTLALAKDMLRSMIRRDRNRASVILWSVANETPESKARLKFLGDLAMTAKKLDGSRLTTAAMFLSWKGNTCTVDDPLSRFVDVAGVNQYFGWYVLKPNEIPKVRWQSKIGKPVIATEFGAGAMKGFRGRASRRWTEDYQALVYRRQLDMLEEIPFLRGATPWILFDFHSPCRMNTYQRGMNRKGILDPQGRKKLAWTVLRDRYRKWRGKDEG